MKFDNKNEIILSEIDLNELIELADEPEDKDTISEQEYRNATDKWRITFENSKP